MLIKIVKFIVKISSSDIDNMLKLTAKISNAKM